MGVENKSGTPGNEFPSGKRVAFSSGLAVSAREDREEDGTFFFTFTQPQPCEVGEEALDIAQCPQAMAKVPPLQSTMLMVFRSEIRCTFKAQMKRAKRTQFHSWL